MQVLIIKKIINFGRDRFVFIKDREITLGSKQTSDMNMFTEDDDQNYSGRSVWKNNILMVNLCDQIVDHSLKSNAISHQYALPMTPVSQTPIADRDLAADLPMQAKEQIVEQSIDLHQHTANLEPDLTNVAEHDDVSPKLIELDPSEHDVEPAPMSELERYHQDYDDEKKRVRDLVEGVDQQRVPAAIHHAVTEITDTEVNTDTEDTAVAVQLSSESVTDHDLEMSPAVEDISLQLDSSESSEAVQEPVAVDVPEEKEESLETEALTEAYALAQIDTAVAVEPVLDETIVDADWAVSDLSAQDAAELDPVELSSVEQDLQQSTDSHLEDIAAARYDATIDLDLLRDIDVTTEQEYQHIQLDQQNELNHQKIMDTYRKISEMYK